MNRGVLYVAYGRSAIYEVTQSIKSLRRYHDWPVAAIGDKPVSGARFIEAIDTSGGLPGRWAKVRLDLLSPFGDTLFLDADTRVYADIGIGFEIIPQDGDVLNHLSEMERLYTLTEVPYPLQLNSGVMWFRKTERVKALFSEWRREWARFKDKDQGALVRALPRCPVKIWLLGRPFNGGAIIGHRFGACKKATP
jgi:hypothetical protein